MNHFFLITIFCGLFFTASLYANDRERNCAHVLALLRNTGDVHAWLVVADELESDGRGDLAEAMREDAKFTAPAGRIPRERRLEMALPLEFPRNPQPKNPQEAVPVYRNPYDATEHEFEKFAIPVGGVSFTMGSEGGGTWSDEGPWETRLTQSFEMQKNPVTQLQWALVMGKNPAHFTSEGILKLGETGELIDPHRPVERVSWEDAQEFIRRLNADPKSKYVYRLPTEAEWEYAVRAGTTTAYSFGDDVTLLRNYGWYAANSQERTQWVRRLRANPRGLYDVHGNVFEWVEDVYSIERGVVRENNAAVRLLYELLELNDNSRVYRGGSWDLSPEFLRSASRFNEPPHASSNVRGLRLLRTPK